MKKKIIISVDEFLHAHAIENLRGQISAICEDAIRKALGIGINEAEEDRKCVKCNAQGEVWDGFSEVWVCNKCNKAEVRRVSIMAKI